MKRTLFGMTLTACLALTACGGGETAAEDFAVEDARAILETAAFSEGLEQIDTETACLLYGVDYATVSEGAVYASTGATAEEVAVLILTDETAAEAAYTALSYRVEDRMEELAAYQPDEITKLEGAILRKEGTSVLLVVAADYAPVEELLGE